MQKMKNGLMMFCLTVLLSCAALMMNTPTASAMGLQDLTGNYRITESGRLTKYMSYDNTGAIVTFTYENGDFVGTITKGTRGGTRSDTAIIYDVFVENGTSHCTIACFATANFPHGVMKIFDNGATLKFYTDDGDLCYAMRRL